ncbi:MAG: 7-cyano-7-deazaguanine synthase [Terriglobia bacterium]
MAKEQSQRAVILLSGGPDSSTLAYWAKEKYQLQGLFLNLGQFVAAQEERAADRIAAELRMPLHKVILPTFASQIGLGGRLNCNNTEPLMLIMGAEYAHRVAERVLVGIIQDDVKKNPGIPEVVKNTEQNIRLYRGLEGFQIEAPFIEKGKSAVLASGSQMAVPFQHTWSCFEDGAQHCGGCDQCANRREAFKAANLKDPTNYPLHGN